jgi:hypothetical protein
MTNQHGLSKESTGSFEAINEEISDNVFPETQDKEEPRKTLSSECDSIWEQYKEFN